MAGLCRTLPTQVRVEYDAQQAMAQIGAILNKTNKGLHTLQSMQCDLGAIPSDLADINMEWLTNIIANKIAAVEAMPLPKDTIKTMAGEWQTIKSKAASAVSAILCIYAVTPTIQCELQGDEIVCVNRDEWVMAKSTYAIPAKYNEHYRLLGNVVEAVAKLRYYEGKNNIPAKSLELILSRIKSPDDYARMVIDGAFSTDLTQEQFERLYKYERSQL